MTNLREHLWAMDPARTARPLDAEEVTAIRRAMASARPESRRWPLAAGLTLAATALAAVAVLLLWPEKPPTPTPMPVATVAPAPVVQVPHEPTPVVAEVRAPRRRKIEPRAPARAQRVQVREVRFVTANGTQILWTFRCEEGA